MFKIGDKVYDNITNSIGTIISIRKNERYPLLVDFDNITCSYTTEGYYSINGAERYIKKLEDIRASITISQTHILINIGSTRYLLPLHLTSFKVIKDILIVTYDGKEYAMYTDNIDQIVNQILNQTKKEHL